MEKVHLWCLSLLDASTKLHRLQPIRTEEARENSDEDLERSDAGGGDSEEEEEEEFELQPVIHTEKTTEKRKQQKENESKKKKKRKSEAEVEVTAKKSKKSEKSNKTDSKKTAKESKKASKKRLNSKLKDKRESQNVTKETLEEETENSNWTNSNVDISENSKKKIISHNEHNGTAVSQDIHVDPKKIFRIEDNGIEVGESDSLQQKRIDIRKAFANDDVVEDFVKEKSEIEDASKPKDIDLSLPGWGSWAGVGIKPLEKKKKLFTKKADPAPPRKDKDLSHVIINEEKSKLFSKNQVRNGVCEMFKSLKNSSVAALISL